MAVLYQLASDVAADVASPTSNENPLLVQHLGNRADCPEGKAHIEQCGDRVDKALPVDCAHFALWVELLLEVTHMEIAVVGENIASWGR